MLYGFRFKEDEDRFFEKLGLKNIFTNYGLLPEHLKTYQGSEKKGWTFSIEDMERLGILNLRYLGTGKYETEPNVRRHMEVFVLN